MFWLFVFVCFGCFFFTKVKWLVWCFVFVCFGCLINELVVLVFVVGMFWLCCVGLGLLVGWWLEGPFCLGYLCQFKMSCIWICRLWGSLCLLWLFWAGGPAIAEQEEPEQCRNDNHTDDG